MDTTNPFSRLHWLLLAAVTILFLLVAQAYHFHERPYRQDEAWVVHFALANIEQQGFVSHALSPIRHLAPENLLQDIWVHFFGHIENIARYFSTLITALTLATFYRFAADLYDRRTGWLAIMLLGTLSIFTYYSHEARPYALLAFGAVSFPWILLRFIERATLKRGAAAALAATATAFVHPFMSFVIAAQLACVLVFVRWNRALYRRGAALFAALAIIVGYRAYINYAARSGVIRYNMESSWEGLVALYGYFRFNPESLGLLLLLGGVLTLLLKLVRAAPISDMGEDVVIAPLPAGTWLDSRMRFPAFWREGWQMLSAVVMLAIPFLINLSTPSLTPRNMLILAPSLALIAVIALRQAPSHLQALALLFFCVPFVTEFRSFGGNAGYWELAAYIEERYEHERDRLVAVAAAPWELIPINYYLQERASLGLSRHDIFYVSWTSPALEPDSPPSFDANLTASGFGGDDWERLRAYLDGGERVWLMKGNPYAGGQNMLDALESDYILYSAIDFPGETYYRPLEALEYRRKPDASEPLWRFGEDINLLSWRLNNDHIAQPCASISVDTWWSTETALDQLYSTTLVIAGQNGNGIANADDMPGGIHLTTVWQPDRLYFDERFLTIPCDTAEGDYPLLLGMYVIPREDEPLQSLEIHTSAGEPTGRDYEYLTTIHVRR